MQARFIVGRLIALPLRHKLIAAGIEVAFIVGCVVWARHLPPQEYTSSTLLFFDGTAAAKPDSSGLHTDHKQAAELAESILSDDAVKNALGRRSKVRAAIIVALTIPFSLLFASIWLDLSSIPANLLSLGALDFGMVVDGAVVMVENIMRHLSHRRSNGPPKTTAAMIREACHEVQRPVFYAIAIIITAYMPIFTLQRVEGRLFRPMALTVAFALLGALTFSVLIAPVLSSVLFRRGVKERHNPAMAYLTERYRRGLRWCLEHRAFTVGIGLAALAASLFLAFGGVIGSEFLPHLDEGAIWARGTLANSTSLTEGEKFTTNERYVFASFPEVKTVVSEVGRPDDGTDTGGFGNTEYFVDLKPHDDWRPAFHKNKEELIAAMERAVQKYPEAVQPLQLPRLDKDRPLDETMLRE